MNSLSSKEEIVERAKRAAAIVVLDNFHEYRRFGDRVYVIDDLYRDHKVDMNGYELIATALNEEFLIDGLSISARDIFNCKNIQEISEVVLLGLGIP